MGRFNAGKYDPVADSSAGTDKIRKQEGFTGVILAVSEGECGCGCGTKPKGGKSRFQMGHDARLKGVLQRAHLTSTNVLQVVGSDRDISKAMAVATTLGWEGLLRKSELAFKAPKTKATGPKAKAPAKGKGRGVGDAVQVKIGRWTYDATVVKTGAKLTVEYATESGEVKQAQVTKAQVA